MAHFEIELTHSLQMVEAQTVDRNDNWVDFCDSNGIAVFTAAAREVVCIRRTASGDSDA